MTHTLEELEIPKQKIYKNAMIWAGTFLGGPLVAGYMIAENFKAFDETERAKKAWIYAILATIAIFSFVFLVPNIPNKIVPIAYTALAYYLVQHYQEQNINHHISLGGQLFSWGRTIAVSVIGLATILIPVIIAFFIIDAGDVGVSAKTYGRTQNEVSYTIGNITEREVDNIAEALKSATFFSEEETRYVFVEKADTSYNLSIAVSNGDIQEYELIEAFKQLRADVQRQLPNNKIIISLVVDDIENVVKKIE